MSNKTKNEYLLKIKERYFKSTKVEKQTILDEFCKVCGYNLKYAIRLINRKSETSKKSKKTGKPMTAIHIKYNRTNDKPPFSYIAYGNFQMFPKQIAYPVAAKINPAFEPQVSLGCCIMNSGILVRGRV
jgi:hypothetical protein